MREFLELLLVNLAVKKHDFIENLKVVWKFYRNPYFFLTDLLLKSSYFFASPFRISKQFLLKQGASDVYTYGETPLTTLQAIATEALINKKDVLYDLGCGTGRTSFWFHFFIGCRVVGVDYVPAFVKRAERLRKGLAIENIEFTLQDMLQINFRGATALYLYGSCFEEPFLELLIERFKDLTPGSTIVTVSYPLSDYCETPLFEVIKQFSAKFTWGEADVYVQKRLPAL